MTEPTIYLDYNATTPVLPEGQERASAVILAMGIPRTEAVGSVRLTLGRRTTLDEVEKAAASLARAWGSSAQR